MEPLVNPVYPPSIPRALRVLALAYFVQATGALSVVGSLDAVSKEWHLADSQSALLITVFGVTFAIAAPLLQVLLGHLRRRVQVLAGLALFSAAALACGIAPDFPTLLAMRILMGLGACFIGPVLAALGSGLVQAEERGSAIATVLLGLSIAGLVGMPISAWIAHAWGARVLFLVIGITGAFTAAMIVWMVPDHVRGDDVKMSSLLALLVRAESLSAFLVVFFIASAVYTTYAFVAPIVRDVYHGGQADISAALVVLGGAGIIGNIFVARAARRYTAERMLLAGMSLLAVAIVYLWLMPAHVFWLFPALTVWAFATDSLWPSQQRRIIELAPERRGVALALTASFVFCGIGVGSAAAAWIYPRYGFAGLLCGSIMFLLLAVASLGVSVSARARRPAMCVNSTT